eukprot:4970904-Alexandrium_andersonii.AAC.1
MGFDLETVAGRRARRATPRGAAPRAPAARAAPNAPPGAAAARQERQQPAHTTGSCNDIAPLAGGRQDL